MGREWLESWAVGEKPLEILSCASGGFPHHEVQAVDCIHGKA